LTIQRPFTEQTVVKAVSGMQSCEVAGEVVILDLDEGLYFGLNPVGVRIWELLKEPKSVEQIQATLLEEYDVEAVVCHRELLSLLDQLAAHGLVEVTGEDHR
jgi:hypothetical protein